MFRYKLFIFFQHVDKTMCIYSIYIYIYFVPKHLNNMKYKIWFNLTKLFVIIVDLHKSHKRN